MFELMSKRKKLGFVTFLARARQGTFSLLQPPGQPPEATKPNMPRTRSKQLGQHTQEDNRLIFSNHVQWIPLTTNESIEDGQANRTLGKGRPQLPDCGRPLLDTIMSVIFDPLFTVRLE